MSRLAVWLPICPLRFLIIMAATEQFAKAHIA